MMKTPLETRERVTIRLPATKMGRNARAKSREINKITQRFTLCEKLETLKLNELCKRYFSDHPFNN